MEKKTYFSKSNINFIIDALMLLVMCGKIGIGLMIKYVLITGQQKWEKFGANLEQRILGIDRHEWGSIHLYLGFVFLVLFAFHIVLHWNMIGCMYRRLINSLSVRKAFAVPFLSVCFIIIIIPFALKPELKPLEQGFGHFGQKSILQQKDSDEPATDAIKGHVSAANSTDRYKATLIPPDDAASAKKQSALQKTEFGHDNERHHESERTLNIRGYMTIAELCDAHNIPSDFLKEKLRLPAEIFDDTRLSILRRRYSIRMSDIEKAIKGYHAASSNSSED